MVMVNSYIQGLMMGFSLIIPIGAQNAFVLKQGLKKQSVFWVCLVCALSDSILIILGVTGFSVVIQQYPQLIQWAKWGGALFLFWYGLQHALQSFGSEQKMQISADETQHLSKIILICLTLTWLNPHVYLDTVVLLGSISTQFENTKLYFSLGAVTASWLFFFALGYSARIFIPIFENPKAWKILDGVIALVMWGIAISLILNV